MRKTNFFSIRNWVFILLLCFLSVQNVDATPSNLLTDPSFELNNGSWVLGPETVQKKHRGITGVRVATLDAPNQSFIHQTLRIPKTGMYQISFLVSENKPGGVLLIQINGSERARLNLQPRFEWKRRGLEGLKLNKGDVFKVVVTNGEGFVNLEDGGLYLKSETPFDLNAPDAIFVLANVSRIWLVVLVLIVGLICAILALILTFYMIFSELRWILLACFVFAIMWTFGYLWEVLDYSWWGSMLGLQTKITGWMGFSLFIFIFSLWYTGSKIRLWKPGRNTLLVLFPIFLIIIWTDSQYHLLQTNPYVSWWSIWGFLSRDRWGFAILPLALMNNIFQIYAVGNLIVHILTVSKNQRIPLQWFGIAALIQNFGGFILVNVRLEDYFPNLDIAGHDWSSLGFAAAMPFYLISIFGFKMYQRPLAPWLKGQMELSEALIVTNTKNRILEVNAAAKSLFAIEPQGQILLDTMPNFDFRSENFEYRNRIYQPEFSDIVENQRSIGQRLVLHDITDLFQAQTNLELQNQELFTTNTELEKTQDSLKISNSELLEVNSQLEVLQQELREQAVRDKLTGLFNRRYLDESLAKCLSEKQNFSIMLFDIDRFREFNSRFGFAGGDAVLKGVGHFLLARLPKEFMVCRYGGEEFCVLMPLAHDNGLAAARALQDSFAELAVEYANQTLRLTVSSSYASFEKHGVGLLLAADEGLRAAKHNGRNQLFEAVLQAPIWVRGWL